MDFDVIAPGRIVIDSVMKCQRNCKGFYCVMFCAIFLDSLESMMHLVRDDVYSDGRCNEGCFTVSACQVIKYHLSRIWKYQLMR